MSNLTIAVDAKNKLYVDNNGNLAMATDVQAVMQDCASALKAQLGEMIYEPDNGMPTFDDVWRTQNFIKWEAAARSALVAVTGVVRVESFTVDPYSFPGTFVYTAYILTIYSSTLQIIVDSISGV